MITKRTDELKPGDVVETEYGRHVIAYIDTTDADPAWGSMLVRYAPRRRPQPLGMYVEPETTWQVVEPSALDVAVARAQELADQWGTTGVNAGELSEMFDLFRAAR